MRTCKVDAAATGKMGSPVLKKSAGGMQTAPFSAGERAESSPASGSVPNRASSGRRKKLKPKYGSPSILPTFVPQSSVEMTTSSAEATQLTEIAKPAPKAVRKVVKKVIKKKIPVSGRDTSTRVPEMMADGVAMIDETLIEKAFDWSNVAVSVGHEPIYDSPLVGNIQGSVVESKETGNTGEQSNKEEMLDEQQNLIQGTADLYNLEPIVTGAMSVDVPEPTLSKAEDPEEDKEEQAEMNNESMRKHDPSLEEVGDEKIEGISDQEVHEEFGAGNFADYDEPENMAEAETLQDEQVELNFSAKEHGARKEREIFVGGLDRDAVEEDIRKVFKYAGEVVEVRLHKDPATNKNKGFAFVQFAKKEQASYALSEMKNPVIHGKRCGTSSLDGDDTLFLGNICNTWTKDAINQKLKDYGVEGVENLTMVADPRNEGLSRGFVFIEFSSHAEALLAYKRLQKPDVVFGHSERTVKVAFAEPQREPDPEVMAQVKSMFIDGLPSHWDEDRVRENLKVFGEITKILLARNMSTAKRKDFGFVDFNTHQEAVSCVEGVNKNGLNDGNSKVTVRARLSNPLPKMQAIKGGMCGGFRIGHGRGFNQGGQPFNRVNFHYGRAIYPRGAGRGGRMASSREHEFNVPQRPVYGRHHSGRGERWGLRGAYKGPEPSRPYPCRLRHGDRGYGHYEPYRGPTYSFEEGYARPFTGRHLDDSYAYDDVDHRIKRPYYMMTFLDQDSDFAEPSRSRPRLDHSDPAIPNYGIRCQVDELAVDGSFLRQNYYGSGVSFLFLLLPSFLSTKYG
ncbi:nucleolin-like [Dorcoceras hygrometricum]|uniref:Nucleolin-like n=1 Tax=Dorcoceras hygrometricum TaxID=472368 RepID=A0A2Z7D4K4_9LAMI|nr:nucleolin-like [Dorcoceras hygrometricum]